MREIVLIVHDIRSAHNVGSLLRTAEGFGVSIVYFTGYTPYPTLKNDTRLPHIANKLSRQINKTALGSESLIKTEHHVSINSLIDSLKDNDYAIVALEQSSHSISLPRFNAPRKVALLIGREVEGIEPSLLNRCDSIVEIPMYGEKESFNVAQATAVALYALREA